MLRYPVWLNIEANISSIFRDIVLINIRAWLFKRHRRLIELLTPFVSTQNESDLELCGIPSSPTPTGKIYVVFLTSIEDDMHFKLHKKFISDSYSRKISNQEK